ncbi:family 20 glycosylhydrolase [Flavobacterium granuli]|uniref:Hexosaminidase n=1 Tax=Flavobacterium granuli TaxID=280093 RepID=A0A1M5QU93_9FLAO|nr:family 20 glycosylhydrolase [Flavobacterium granuli]PRZ25282.1 hexosaminidase [Flavobacterium granuli]SHH17279.1 hexosaminidase [Flavobacterium granuli]
MNYKQYLVLMGFVLMSMQASAQAKMTKSDSIYLKEKVVMKSFISKGTSFYKMPDSPEGYLVQLIGSDNLSVISKSGAIFCPLNTMTVNLLFKAIKIADGASIEIPIAVNVEGSYKDQGKNAKPFVIPSLREWHGAEGNLLLTAKSRIVVDARYSATLMQAAKVFQNDLFALRKIKPEVIIGIPKYGDIFISLDGNSEELGAEGYSLSIKDYVSIHAAQYKGAFWGTRSILQILEQDAKLSSLPKGISRDYPKYEVRGFMLDVGRKYFSIDFLRDYVKMMSYYKMGDFQLHLNDNAFVKHFNNDWDSTYSGFRLENEKYPQLPTKGEFYTKKEFIDLQVLAESYGINIIPEIDVPAHSLAFSKAFPQIASKEYGKDHLDIKNPETYTIIENVLKEYLEGDSPVFRFKEVHIGTDEYDKKEAEPFRKFTDHFIKYVQSFGKDVRVWGALTHAQGTTPVTSKGVTMNAWYNGYADPVKMKELGYPLISTPDGLLYIVPAAGYYYDYLNIKQLYNNWEPLTIGNVIFKKGDPFIRGGMFAVWNDVAKNGITAQDVTDRVFPALQVLSEKMWTGTNAAVDFNGFSANAKNINEGPGLNLRGIIKAKDSLVLNFALKGKDKIKEKQYVNYASDGKRKVLNLKQKESYAKLPYNEIGYNYTVSFTINPSENNAANAVLFHSKHATVKLKQGNTSNLGFSHEGKDYDFGVAIPENKWTSVAITGDNNSTTLYVDGKLAKKLTREKIPTGYEKDSIWVMKTLFFPLNTIGDGSNSFMGKIKNLKVFNTILSDAQIQAIKEEE